jgi:N-acetylneuraminic acid mutarotase
MPTARSEMAAAALGRGIYVAGGIARWGTTAAFEAFDPPRNRWEELPPLPEAVHHLAVAAADDRVYVTGGYTNLLFTEITERAWAYDPRARTWARGPDLPTPRSGLTAGVLDGHIHVTGGESLSLGRTFGEHEMHDPTTARWTALAGLPTPRHGLASAVVGGRWYVIGGGVKAGALTFISLTDLVEVFPSEPG